MSQVYGLSCDRNSIHTESTIIRTDLQLIAQQVEQGPKALCRWFDSILTQQVQFLPSFIIDFVTFFNLRPALGHAKWQYSACYQRQRMLAQAYYQQMGYKSDGLTITEIADHVIRNNNTLIVSSNYKRVCKEYQQCLGSIPAIEILCQVGQT